MDTQYINTKRHFPSGRKLSSTFYKLIIVGIFICLLLIANHIEMPVAVGENRTKINQPEKSKVNTKGQETVNAKSITITADTLQSTLKADIEIATQETTTTLTAEVDGLWQESRPRLDQPDISNAITETQKTVKTNTITTTTLRTTINTETETIKQSKTVSVKNNDLLQENKRVTGIELTVHKNTSIGRKGQVIPQSGNKAVYLEPHVKGITEKGKTLSNSELKGENTEMDKENILPQVSGQVTRPDVIQATNLESDVKDITEKENKLGKVDQKVENTNMDTENISLQNSGQATSHSVIKTTNLEADVKDITEKEKKLGKSDQKGTNTKMDKGHLSPEDSGQVAHHDVIRAAHLEADVKEITGKEQKLDTLEKTGKSTEMDKENISPEGNVHVTRPNGIRAAKLEADVKDITEYEKKLSKSDQKVKNTKMEKENLSPEGSGQVAYPDVIRATNLEAYVKDITEKEKTLFKSDKKGKNIKMEKENLSTEGNGQVAHPKVIRATHLVADVKDITETEKKLGRSDKKGKNTKMVKENISLEDSRQVTSRGVIGEINLEANVKDITEKEMKLGKSVQTGKNTMMVKENISPDSSGHVTRPGGIRAANLEADVKDITGKKQRLDTSEKTGKSTEMDKENISPEGSADVTRSNGFRAAKLEADVKDITEKAKKLGKSNQKDKTTKMDKENISQEGSKPVTRPDVIKAKHLETDVTDIRVKGKNLGEADQKSKHTKVEKGAMTLEGPIQKKSQSINLEANGKGIKDKAKKPDEEVNKAKTINRKKEEDISKAAGRVPYHKTKSINQSKDSSDGKWRPKETKHYGKDDGSDYIKTKYVMHKLLKDNGPKLSAKLRAKLVKERCQTFLKENNIRLNPNVKCKYDGDSYLTSRRYNISICYNSKVASTNTKRVLYALDHKFTDDINSIKQHEAREYSKSRVKYFKQVMSGKRHINIMMVREPLERLLSAYRDDRAFKDEFKDPSFSFKKYLQLILVQNMNNMNRHIYPYFERCRPCEMQFDFIGLQNHFNDDIEIVLQKMGAGGKIGIPKRKKTGYTSVSSDKLVKQYFKDIPNDMIHKLWEKYYKDYYIFGFPYPVHLMN